MSRKRGTYLTYEKHFAVGAGAFVYSLRMARRMTQAEYAKFLGVSLRTLVTAEKCDSKHAPYGGSAVGHGLATKEFANEFDMRRAFGEFLQEKARGRNA